MEKYKVACLIPARGGSERIPKKNIKVIAGKPMMNWTIEASLGSKYIERTFVSTEDSEIKEIALKAGAEVIDRPAEFATDSRAELNGVVSNFREHLNSINYYPDYMVFLHVTAPLRTAQHIDEAFELLLDSNYELLESVTPFHAYPHTALKFLNEKGRTEFVIENFRRRFNQGRDRGKVYISNGALYIGGYTCFNYYATAHLSAQAYIMKPEDSIDIDTPFDFEFAEYLLKKRMHNEQQKMLKLDSI